MCRTMMLDCFVLPGKHFKDENPTDSPRKNGDTGDGSDLAR